MLHTCLGSLFRYISTLSPFSPVGKSWQGGYSLHCMFFLCFCQVSAVFSCIAVDGLSLLTTFLTGRNSTKMSGDTRVKGTSKLKNRNRKRALMHELEKQEYQQEQSLNTDECCEPAASLSRASIKKVVLLSASFETMSKIASHTLKKSFLRLFDLVKLSQSSSVNLIKSL